MRLRNCIQELCHAKRGHRTAAECAIVLIMLGVIPKLLVTPSRSCRVLTGAAAISIGKSVSSLYSPFHRPYLPNVRCDSSRSWALGYRNARLRSAGFRHGCGQPEGQCGGNVSRDPARQESSDAGTQDDRHDQVPGRISPPRGVRAASGATHTLLTTLYKNWHNRCWS
jgi:hypothetical protein